jgi:hypothetical protein
MKAGTMLSDSSELRSRKIKIKPISGNIMDMSFFMATYYMYFPFPTCEVKCGATALDVADRQNAHNMTLAVRAIVELFRLVKMFLQKGPRKTDPAKYLGSKSANGLL